MSGPRRPPQLRATCAGSASEATTAAPGAAGFLVAAELAVGRAADVESG
jgi:hypothetical protein